MAIFLSSRALFGINPTHGSPKLVHPTGYKINRECLKYTAKGYTMEKLDRYIPTQDMIAGVRRQLVNAGISPEALPQDWLVAILAATNKWHKTKEGLRHLVKSNGFGYHLGSDDVLYEYYDPTSGEVYAINSKRITLLHGTAIDGTMVDPTLLSEFPKEHKQCESCGVISYCVKEVRDPIKDRLEDLCNSCLAKDDNKAKLQADLQMCNECTVTRCHNNPQYKKIVHAR